MDFDAASQSHFEWKSKLRKYLAHPNGSLDASSIALDGECVLGKWIHAEAAKHSSEATFRDLREKHAKFHKAAAQLVKRADAGEKVDAETALGAASEFNHLSLEVTTLIREMKLKSSATPIR